MNMHYIEYSIRPRAIEEFLHMRFVRVLKTEKGYKFSLANKNNTELRAHGLEYVIRYAEEDYKKIKEYKCGSTLFDIELCKTIKRGVEYPEIEKRWKEYPIVGEFPIEEVGSYYPFASDDFLHIEAVRAKHVLMRANLLVTWILSARTEEEAMERARRLYRAESLARKEFLLEDGNTLIGIRPWLYIEAFESAEINDMLYINRLKDDI